MSARLLPLLRRAVRVRDEEVAALLWAFCYFFALLCAYYILRPLREEMGIAGGVDNLQWLFTGTFVAMLAAVPVFGWLVRRFPRRRFVPLVYRFFIVCLLVFFALLTWGDGRVYVARAFFIWVSLFNLFVVSVFWSFMADLFRPEQSRRLFGFVAAGGTAGALLGPTLTATLAVPLGPTNLLLVSALFLEGAVQCIRRLLRQPLGEPAPAPGTEAPAGGAHGADGASPRAEEPALGGSVLAGATHVLRSPYLLGICGYIVLYTTTSTFLYFQQAHIVANAFDDPAQRTRLFAVIDMLVSLLTLLTQVFLTGRVIHWIGVGAAVAFLPLLTALGFLALAAAPVVALLVGFQAVRRAANYAISRPARETLFTVIPREDKYKAKNFIDTVVYRGGDAASGWAYAGLSGVGLEVAAIALLAAPIAVGWMGLGLLLGRRQPRIAPQPAA